MVSIYVFRFVILLAFLLFLPTHSFATTVFEDNFDDLTKVDTNRTTAKVDTTNSNVRLPEASQPNAVAMNKYGDGYAVVTKTGIHLYEYDDAKGKASINNAFSVPFITDAIGVALRHDNMNMWAISTDGVQFIKFNGSSMSDNPALKASGIGQVLSVDAWENNDRAVVLLNNNGKAQLQIYDGSGGNIASQLTQNTNITDPVAVSIVKGTADLRVATKNSIYYLMYDDAAGQYVEDISKKISGFSDLISTSTDESTHAVTTSSDAKFVFDNDSGGGTTVSAFSIGAITDAFAISLKPGCYDQAIVTLSGEVQYWRYDDAKNKMVRDISMEQTGLQLMGGYLTPKEYWSKSFTTPYGYDEVKLTVNHDVPANTSITYWVSSNGGINFIQVIPNIWISLPVGNNFVVKADLATTDTSVTPKIFYIKLEATTLLLKDLEVTAIAKNKPSQTLPTSMFPVEAKAGADVIFEITTEGGAENVQANFSTGAVVDLTNRQPLADNINIWWGSFLVPIDAVDPSLISVTITAKKGVKQKHLTVNPFIEVHGQIYEIIDLQMTK